MRRTSYTQAIRLGMNEAIEQEKVRVGARQDEDFVTRMGRISAEPRSGPRLNFGDCMAYALAKSLEAPLLFKGGNFSQTDIASAA